MKRSILVIIFTVALCRLSTGQNISIGYNLAGSIISPLNIESNYGISSKVSLYSDIQYNPLSMNSRRFISISPGIKIWKWHINAGFYYGMGFNYSKYNLQLKKWRYQGEAYGFGLLYGYSKIINYKTNIQLSAGIGAYLIKNDQFEKGKCGDYQQSNSSLKVLPYQISISLVRIIKL